MNIINANLYDELFDLYNERNKIVHRYVITDIKTYTLYKTAYEYEKMSEKIRLILRGIETEQFDKKVGYFRHKDPYCGVGKNDELFLKSMINEKHFLNDFYRNFE